MPPSPHLRHASSISSALCAIHDGTSPDSDLTLPDAEGFRSLPPGVSLARMIQRSRQLRQWFRSGLRSANERWLARAAVEFDL
jgi:hypothetical protein